MILSRILHAGYVVETGPLGLSESAARELTRIAFDPILESPFSTNCFSFPSVSFGEAPRFDAVFISHFHDDHCSLVSLAKLARETPIFIYCVHNELFKMIRGLGFKSVTPLLLDRPVDVGAIRVTALLALDPDVDCVLLIEADGQKVLNVVDAWIDPATVDRLRDLDVVLWPFQTMLEAAVLAPGLVEPAERTLPPEWLEQIGAMNPRLVIPSSCQLRFEDWSWWNRAYFPISYAQFAREVPNSRRLDPGESLDVGTLERRAKLDWVRRESIELETGSSHGNDDYEYDPEPRPTSEIARRFPALTVEQRSRVDAFCLNFDVLVFDHEGHSIRFGANAPAPIEAIAYKIHRALEHGEAITSMYLRVTRLEESGPFENPLILALSADPLSFQRAQLRALLAKSI